MAPSSLSPEELKRAISILTDHLNKGGLTFVISGDPATEELRRSYNEGRSTEVHIFLGIQPDPARVINAETLPDYLVGLNSRFQTDFIEKSVLGKKMPFLVLRKDDNSKIDIGIKIWEIPLSQTGVSKTT
ncbi:hypothetical protein F4777DRAFT_576792 [Nemania sp. FL0916]|nr:hypothetical protein F4777DRAFT_576792 [Nemania sp. FL0916]